MTLTGSSTLVRGCAGQGRGAGGEEPAAAVARGRISSPAAMAAVPAQTTAAGPKRRESLLDPASHVDHARLIEAVRRGNADTAASEAAGYPFGCLCKR